MARPPRVRGHGARGYNVLEEGTMSTTRTITDDELLNLPKDGNKYEVVDGELRMSPAGWRHEIVVMN